MTGRGAKTRRWLGPPAWRAVALAACVTVASCASEGSEKAPRAMEAPPSADRWLASVSATHRAVDEALERGARDAAVARLRSTLTAATPRDVAADDLRVVRQDLWYRLAEVELARQRHGDALAAADAGLALGRVADVFGANLHIVRGHALEGLGRDADAAASYGAALEINQALLAQALGRGDGGPR